MEVELPTEYDVIVVGTGFVECIVAAASARIGKKVLHIDKNDYYGGQWASFTLQGIEQWITASEDQQKETEKAYELEEGETVLATSNPRIAYTSMKRNWHVKKEDEMAPTCKDASSTPEGKPLENISDKHSAEEKPEETTDDLEAQSKEVPPIVHTDKGAGEDMEVTETNATENVYKETSSSASNEGMESPCWSQESMLKLSRRYNLDLAPKLLFSRGPLVELLISSNVARYAEFKCITRVLTWLGEEEGELVVVPCSRSDVFTTNSVSLVEKRLLMKLLEFCHSYDQHPEALEEVADKTFIDFLKSRRQTPNLIHFVTESIAMVDGKVSCKEGLEKTKLFLTSLGRYGTTPFLFSMYGCGELPQAFCRLCAVFEGTYILRRPTSSIILNADKSCVGIISEGVRFKCSHLVMDAMYAPHQYLSVPQPSTQNMISRGIFITDKSILPNEKEQLTLLRMPAQGKNMKPNTIFEVGIGAGVCPIDLYCVHMTCLGCNAEEDFKIAVERLFASVESSAKPKVLWSLYFNQVDTSDSKDMKAVPENIYLCSGPDASLDYDSAISQARSLFSRMFPKEEFLPRAPDPDEIVFDNAGAEPKEGDNFSAHGPAENADAETSDKNREGEDAPATEIKASEFEESSSTNELKDPDSL